MNEKIIDGILLDWDDASFRVEGEGEAETTYFNKAFPTDNVVKIIQYLVQYNLNDEDAIVADNQILLTNPFGDEAEPIACPFDSNSDARVAHELVNYFFFVKRSDAGEFDDEDDFDDD